jgi:hypothetical protein
MDSALIMGVYTSTYDSNLWHDKKCCNGDFLNPCRSFVMKVFGYYVSRLFIPGKSNSDQDIYDFHPQFGYVRIILKSKSIQFQLNSVSIDFKIMTQDIEKN